MSLRTDRPTRSCRASTSKRRRSRQREPVRRRAGNPMAILPARIDTCARGCLPGRIALCVEGAAHMSPMRSEDAIAAKGRPFTGAEYLASLRDGREIYVYGERVEDVTTHPAFRNAARSIARLYDALHDAKTKDLLTSPTDTGSGGFTHKFFRAARSREELIAQRDAIAQWARMSYGWMGRSPASKAAVMTTLGANHRFYGKFSDNAQTWYRRAQEHVLFMNHAIVNPPVDRAKAADQVKDVFITIQKEPDAGVTQTGAKG